jgi:hypothetical protein
MRLGHTHFRRGKRVRIKLKDGAILIRRFDAHLDDSVRVSDVDTGHSVEKIPLKRVLSISIFKRAS